MWSTAEVDDALGAKSGTLAADPSGTADPGGPREAARIPALDHHPAIPQFGDESGVLVWVE